MTLAPRGEAAPRQRRASRFLVVPSGWVLLLCLVLPSLRFCDGGAAVPCLILPPVWPPFLAGLLIALAALAGPRGAAASALRLGRFTYGIVLGYGLVIVHAWYRGELGWDVLAPAVAVSLVVWSIARWCRRARTELAVAALAWLLSLGSALCGLALGLAPDAVWGGQVTAVAAAALALGTTWWLGEAAIGHRLGRR